MANKPVPLGRQTVKVGNKYALQLGRMVAGWNLLHESLAFLFWRATGIADESIAMAIWHSTSSDLSQRKMLRAAVEIRYLEEMKTREEILWLISKIDSTLSGKRNDATHAPVAFLYSEGVVSIIPADDTGNPRAKSLMGKAVIEEITWYGRIAMVLSEHAIDLYQALDSDTPLPKRPLLPTLDQPPLAKKKTQAAPRKAP